MWKLHTTIVDLEIFITSTSENHANLLTYIVNWLLYTLENGFFEALLTIGPFLGYAQAFSVLIVKKKKRKCRNGKTIAKTRLCVLSLCTSTIGQCSNKFSLPPFYPLHHSCEKLFQALYRFYILQVTESRAGCGNNANFVPCIIWEEDCLSLDTLCLWLDNQYTVIQ